MYLSVTIRFIGTLRFHCQAVQWRIQGEGPGDPDPAVPPPPPPPSPFRPETCLRLKFLHRQDRVSLFNWLNFLMTRALHFATKLNPRDIQKFNCFWVSSYHLLASVRKAVFPAPTVTGVHRLKLEICIIFVTKPQRRMFQGCNLYQ